MLYLLWEYFHGITCYERNIQQLNPAKNASNWGHALRTVQNRCELSWRAKKYITSPYYPSMFPRIEHWANIQHRPESTPGQRAFVMYPLLCWHCPCVRVTRQAWGKHHIIPLSGPTLSCRTINSAAMSNPLALCTLSLRQITPARHDSRFAADFGLKWFRSLQADKISQTGWRIALRWTRKKTKIKIDKQNTAGTHS